MRDNNLGRREGGLSGGMIAAIATALVIAILFIWAPWNGSKIADNTAPGTTTGSSTSRPAPSTAPTAPPSTTPAR